MPYYRFYYTDSAGSLVGFVLLELNDDSCAIARADALLASSIYAGIEVWDRARLFYRKVKDEPSVQRECNLTGGCPEG